MGTEEIDFEAFKGGLSDAEKRVGVKMPNSEKYIVVEFCRGAVDVEEFSTEIKARQYIEHCCETDHSECYLAKVMEVFDEHGETIMVEEN